MRVSRIVTCAFLVVCAMVSYAQDTIYFSKALIVKGVHRYGREALYHDQLASQLYNGTLKAPAEGLELGKNEKGDPVKWQTINADSLHRFLGGRGSQGAYVYLTYNSDKEQTALLNIRGNSSVIVNGEPHAGDPYGSGWLYIPVKLKRGLNELYVRSGFFTLPKLVINTRPVQLNTEDPTLPFIRINSDEKKLKAAIVVINSSAKPLKNLQITSSVAGKNVSTTVPDVPAMSTRKISFDFDASGVTNEGEVECSIALVEKGKTIDQKTIKLDAVGEDKHYSNTFVSNIDGSLQYYGVAPQKSSDTKNSALFLSVHGAGVEAIGQARAYKPKDWGTLVAPTNRRPRGFNWEDWGRLDALEVFNIAKDRFKPDPSRIYLTGHSMGGHGTWFLGATYPGNWAAIAPCAGYPTLKDYGSHDGRVPDTATSPIESTLIRASNQSDVIKLATNYKPLGVYIFHGDSDRVVPVRYARQMREVLAEFHPDMSYYEYPGGSHWFGDHSVDWDPIFNFFKWHTILPDSAVNTIDFISSSPGISSTYRWATIYQQEQPLEYSRLQLKRNVRAKMITGSTQNVRLLNFGLKEFGNGASIKIFLDSLNTIEYKTKSANDSVFIVKTNNSWSITEKPSLAQKGPHRYGTIKDGFNHRMVFVYGTKGNKAENEWNLNKARYDAETWYYRGNGAVDIISDKDYSASAYAGRNVVIYGNATTNAAWNILLNDAPIRVERNSIKLGNETFNGDDLAAYFVWPMKNSDINSVAVISGTGLKGLNAATANQYFAGASGFPDYMIFSTGMLESGVKGIKAAGFFDHEWKLSDNNVVKE